MRADLSKTMESMAHLKSVADRGELSYDQTNEVIDGFRLTLLQAIKNPGKVIH